MPNSKPFVQAACVCEKLLVETDGVASLVRIFDTVQLTARENQFPDVVLTGFVSLKSSGQIGTFTVGMRMRRPDGRGGKLLTFSAKFERDGAGVNTRIDITVKTPVAGLYWFDILWGEDVLTSIPITIILNTPPPEAAHGETKP
jgi:hypothetical protein